MGHTRPGGRPTDAVLLVTAASSDAALPPVTREPPAVDLLRRALDQGVAIGGVTALVPAGLADHARTVLAAIGPDVAVRPYDDRRDDGSNASGAAVPDVTDGHLPLSAVLAEALAAGTHPVVLASADVVVNGPPLGALLDDARVATGVLTAPAAAGGSLTVERGHVRGPGDHTAALGLMRVDGQDRPAVAAAVRPSAGSGAGATGGTPGSTPEGADASHADPVLTVTAAAVEAGVAVRAVPLGPYAWGRPSSWDDLVTARAAVDGVDEQAVRLRAAARGGDGFYSTFVLRRISPWLTRGALRLGLTPNGVTLASLVLGLAAAACLAEGSRSGALVAAVLLQLCLLVDCVDGELARYRRRFSAFGAWLDATTDRVKEFAVVAALAVAATGGPDGAGGMSDAGEPGVWAMAGAAIALQTFRHLFDLGWATQREDAVPQPARPSPMQWRTPAGTPVVAVDGGERPGVQGWLRRIGHFPIGERFLVISVGIALASPTATLTVLVAAGALSAAYMIAAFAVRARPVHTVSPRLLAMTDTGPLLTVLVRRVACRAGRGAALLPAAVATAELAAVLAVAGPARPAAGSWPAAVVLAAVVALTHYQRAYRVREGGTGDRHRWGVELRLAAVVVVCVMTVVAPGPLGVPGGLWLLAVAVGAGSLATSAREWWPRRSLRTGGRTGAVPSSGLVPGRPA